MHPIESKTSNKFFHSHNIFIILKSSQTKFIFPPSLYNIFQIDFTHIPHIYADINVQIHFVSKPSPLGFAQDLTWGQNKNSDIC